VIDVETARLRLRRWSEDDLPHVRAMLTDWEVMQLQPDGALTEEAAEWLSIERYLDTWTRHGFGMWAVDLKETGRFVGLLGLQFPGHWPDAELSIVLDKTCWNRGLGTEGGTAALEFGLVQLGLVRILGLCMPGHGASERLMQKLGMVLTDINTCARSGAPTIGYEMTRAQFLLRHGR
jgi:RimJ/RimL family protein N-acetyltransferase